MDADHPIGRAILFSWLEAAQRQASPAILDLGHRPDALGPGLAGLTLGQACRWGLGSGPSGLWCPWAGQGSAAVAAVPASPGSPRRGPARAGCTAGLAAVMVPAWGSLRPLRQLAACMVSRPC